jgi:hypothetical protein
MRSLAELGDQDRFMRGIEFCRLAKHFAAGGGNWWGVVEAAERSGAPERVIAAAKHMNSVARTKAAVGAAGPLAGQWGSALIGPFNQLAQAFLDGLRSRSAFLAMLPNFVRIPLNTIVAIQTADATGWIVGAGKPVPLSKLALTNATVEPIKAAAMVVTTEELLRDASPGAESAFNRALRAAVVDTVDRTALAALASGIVPSTASANPMTDLRAMLDIVNLTGGGTLMWVMTPSVANRASTKLNTSGDRTFPDMTPTGGTMLGLPAYVTRAMPSAGSPESTETMMLIDGTGVVAATGEMELDASRQASVEMRDDPVQDAIAPTSAIMVSVFQTDGVVLLAKIDFAIERVRTNAVAVLEQVAW